MERAAQLAAWRAHEAKLAAQRKTAEEKERMVTAKYTAPNFCGTTVHIAKGLMSPEDISSTLVRYHMRRAPAPYYDSNMFVVPDVAKPPFVVTWIAMLSGALVVSSEYFRGGGNAGVCISYASHLLVERWLWLSPLFVRHHRSLATVLHHFFQKRQCIWRILPTLDDVLRKQAAAPSKRSRYVALVTDEDKRSRPELCNNKFVCTASEFVSISTKLQPDRCRKNLCGT